MKGKHHSETSKKKMSISQLNRKERDGFINSPEARRKLSRALKGKPSKTKGEKHPNYGKHLPEETKQKISETWKTKYKNGYHHPLQGKHHSEEAKQKNREKHLGKNNYGWNSNREEIYAPYGVNFYDDVIREEKWTFQNGRDLLTGIKLKRGHESHLHHIDYKKENDCVDNFCWLSVINHNKITGYKTNSIKKEYYKKLLQKNLELLKEGKVPENWDIQNKKLFKQENLIQLRLPINQIKNY